MDDKTVLKWFEKEKNIFEKSIIALVGALFIDKLTNFSLLGQPYNLGITISLFVFCMFFCIKNHLAEFRLKKLYSDVANNQTDREKSIEQIADEFYLYLTHLLCLSIVHFYIFLPIFFIYLLLSQYYNIVYSNHQKKIRLKWGNDKFNPDKLFRNWISINNLEIFLILATVCSILLLNIDSKLVTYIFILLLFIIEIFVDWLFLNRDFYLDYFEEEI